MAKDDVAKEKEPELEKPATRDPGGALMARLGRVVEVLEREILFWAGTVIHGGLLAELSQEERVTPEKWEDVAQHPGHVVALICANALLDAVVLACPGTDRDRAQELATQLLDEQWEHGMFHVSQGDDPGEHLAEWDAAMAAILYVAHKAPLPLIEERAAGWWRQALDGSGAVPIPTKARDFICHFIDSGRRFADAPLAARFFYLMENVPLPKPFRPWKVVV